MTEPKILIGDIETSPNRGFFWGCGKQFVGPDQIDEERKIICASWKWLHKDKVRHVDWGKDRDDSRVLEKFLPVVEDADMVVFHNGNRFDIPWIQGRLMYYDLPPFPKVKTLDTYKEARAAFRLNSNRLNYIAEYIGREGKLNVPYQLWKDLMNFNRPKDRKTMVEYCDQDILVLESVYKRILPYIANTFNLSVFLEDPEACPKCGGELRKKGFSYTQVAIKQRYKCMDCGANCVSGKSVNKNLSNYPR